MQPEDEKPPIDPTVISRAYKRERASRQIREGRARARNRAHVRFYVTMLVMLAAVAAIALLIWQETQSLFGI
jgi:type IV secretory pathway TrbF-like protein